MDFCFYRSSAEKSWYSHCIHFWNWKPYQGPPQVCLGKAWWQKTTPGYEEKRNSGPQWSWIEQLTVCGMFRIETVMYMAVGDRIHLKFPFIVLTCVFFCSRHLNIRVYYCLPFTCTLISELTLHDVIVCVCTNQTCIAWDMKTLALSCIWIFSF